MMVFVDPAHSAFEGLPREHQAWIYRHHIGWTVATIADELDVSTFAVRYWTSPGARERQIAKSARARASRQQEAA